MSRLSPHKFPVFMRFVVAAWIAMLVVVSIFPVSFKVKLHTMGSWHDFGHYLAFFITAIFLSLLTSRPLGKSLSFVGGAIFSYTQEWAENRLYHAGFEWKDVGNDLAGLVSGFALMVLISAVVTDMRSRRI